MTSPLICDESSMEKDQKTWIGQGMIKKSYMSALAFQNSTHNLGSWSTI